MSQASPSWSRRMYTNYLEFFCTRDLSLLHLFPRLVIYLHQNGLKDIYCKFLIIIQYDIVYLIAHIVADFAPECLFRLAPMSLWCAYILWAFWALQKSSQLILCTSCPSPRISQFSWEPWFFFFFFFLDNHIRNQDYLGELSVTTGASLWDTGRRSVTGGGNVMV